MPRKKATEMGAEESPGESPIVLVGEPGKLRGELFLHNTGEARMVFRGAELRSRAADVTKAAKPVEQMMVTRKVPAAIVKPGQRRRIPLRFSLEPTTPPGEYRTSLQMADQSWPIILQVTETINLNISPSFLVLHNRAGSIATRTVFMENKGNVDLDIDDVSAVPLDDELAQCRILRGVAEVIGSQEESDLDHILTEFAHQAKSVLDKAGILRVRNRTGRLTLHPGELRSIELEMRLPDSLDKRTRYIAILPIYNANLTFSIVPALDVLNSDKPKVN